MNVYDSAHIRNLALVGHGASGKTTLVNAMAWLAGSCGRMGSVQDGTSLTDFTADETEHQISISLGMAYAEFMDTKVNLSIRRVISISPGRSCPVCESQTARASW